jgi:hypothetical protein
MGMSGLIDAVISWPTFALILVVFGFAPGALLRLIVLAFPRDDPRRQELRAELYAVPRIERPFWVAEQLEVALFEGLWKAPGASDHEANDQPDAPGPNRGRPVARPCSRPDLGVVAVLHPPWRA